MTGGSVRRLVFLGTAASALVACSGTTYDSSLVTTTAVVATTTSTLPEGTAADLLPRLLDEGEQVSPLLQADGDARSAVERLTALWAAVRDEVQASRPDLVDGFEQQIDRFARAVEFDRAADADKSARNLAALIDAYLG